MDRSDLQRLSKDELIDLVLWLPPSEKTSRATKELRNKDRPGDAKPGND